MVKRWGENGPTFKKKNHYCLTTILLFWIVFEFWNFSKSRTYENEVNWIINGSLAFFGARMIQLVCQVNPMFQELVNYLKSKSSKTDVIENES